MRTLTLLLAVLTVYSFQADAPKKFHYECLQFIPAAYEKDPVKRWPLLLCLHGSGERGTDPWQAAQHGPPKLLNKNATLSLAERAIVPKIAENFIVLAPQCPPGAVWENDALLALVDDAVKRLRIDPQRIYVTGLSMGGYGTWSLIAHAPERFAAAVPISGGGSTLEFLVDEDRKQPAWRTLGIWAFHGEKDQAVAVEESQRMIEICKRSGVTDLKLTVYPDAQHDAWTDTYANPQLYTWLLQHKRGP